MRYLIFAGNHYYPEGGAKDLFATVADGVEACEKAAEQYNRLVAEWGNYNAWCHVWDIELGKIIWVMGDR